MRRGTAGPGDAIQVRRQRHETLLVVRLTAQARHVHVIDVGVRERRRRSSAASSARQRAPASYDAPAAAQQPFGHAQQDQQQEHGGHVPQILELLHRDSGIGKGYRTRQPVQIIRRPIPPARIRGERLQQGDVLAGVEILRDPILALEGDGVATGARAHPGLP